MKEIGNAELDCLRRIAKGYSNVLSPCAETVLNRLLSMRLIEQQPSTWLPLEMAKSTYHLTSIGRNYLEQLNENKGSK